MDSRRASELRDAWLAHHPEGEEPDEAAVRAVVRALDSQVPKPEAAAAVVDADGRRRVAAMAGGALYLVWAVPRGARCRRVPLEPGATAVEVSERDEGGESRRFWWFGIEADPLVFVAGEADPAAEGLAVALAKALGWPLA